MKKILVPTIFLLTILALAGVALAETPATAAAEPSLGALAADIFEPAPSSTEAAGVPEPEWRQQTDCSFFSGACLRFLCECGNTCAPCGVQSSTCFPTRQCICKQC